MTTIVHFIEECFAKVVLSSGPLFDIFLYLVDEKESLQME